MSQLALPDFKNEHDAAFFIYLEPVFEESQSDSGQVVLLPKWIWKPLGTELEYDEEDYAIIPEEIRVLGTRNSFQDT